jgi:hypothetical protein
MTFDNLALCTPSDFGKAEQLFSNAVVVSVTATTLPLIIAVAAATASLPGDPFKAPYQSRVLVGTSGNHVFPQVRH